jgi:hypothetical protein
VPLPLAKKKKSSFGKDEIYFMNLEGAVLKTISYFDLFDYPLTRAEIWKYLVGEKINLLETDTAISALVGSGRLQENNGLIFLPGRGSIASTRESRYRHSCRKWRRARRWANVFSGIPGVMLVAIGNTLSYNNAKDESDVDFFIVVRRGNLWRTRIFAAALAAFLRLRPIPGDSRDKLCLSFFVADDNLDLQKFSISVPTDIYLAYWIAQLAPLRGQAGVYESFLSENDWIKAILPNVFGRSAYRGAAGFWKYLFAPLAVLPGSFLKNFQTRRFPLALREAMRRSDGSVVIGDDVLKFHLNDRRAKIYDEWVRRIPNI